MIKLGRRLNALAELVSPCGVIADIGSDHGFLPCFLLESGKAQMALVTDISAKSLFKAQKLICKKGLESKAKFFCTDGFKGINERPDAAVIAGMGGMEMINILQDAEKLPEELILQPMRDAVKLRRYLTEILLYRIVTDRIVCAEGKYYVIIKADNTASEKLGEYEIYFGKTNIKEKSRDYINYLVRERKRLSAVAANIKDGGAHIYKEIAMIDSQLNLQ